MRTTLFTCLVVLLVAAHTACGAVSLPASQPAAGALPQSMQKEVDAAVDRGLAWLAAHQKEDGSWSNGSFPALTALPVWAMLRSGNPGYKAAIDRGLAYITSCARDDGGIYRHVEGRKGGGLSNYNTAICMTVLHAANGPALNHYVLRAREFIAGAQHFGDDVYRGGFGYDRDTGRAYTDLLNTFYSVQAMRLTADAEDRRNPAEKRVDLDWAETTKYIERMQNRGGAGADNDGGFFYNPSDPKAGATTNKAGVVVFRSYGSMTYVGLLGLLYADVSRDDPRVRSAFDWSARHWSLDENPGMGKQGLFFFYNVLSRALSAYGQNLVPRAKGAPLDWRRAVADRLVSLQKTDPHTGHGYWVNESARFWESNTVLVTAYALLSLQAIE